MKKIQTGRNLPVAILLTIFLISLVIFCLYVAEFLFPYLVITALLMAAYELNSQWRKAGLDIVPFSLTAISLITLLFTSVYFGLNGLLLSYLVIFIITTIFSLKYLQTNKFKPVFLISIFVVSYLGILGSSAMLMLESTDGASRVFVFIAATALSDTGGYLTGILFGKHFIAPNISPKKSYEGLVGSIVFAGIFGYFAMPLFLDLGPIQGVIIAILLAIVGTMGDLFESGLKRKIGIKDFSSLIPGHGGMFDRLDSLAPNALISYIAFGITLGFI